MSSAIHSPITPLDPEVLRRDFPVLSRKFDDKPLSYLDSTATTQKPLKVMDAINEYYRTYCSSVKRGVYRLSEHTTQTCENTRRKVATFIGAKSEDEIIFTSGTTASINLVAQSWGRKNIGEGDEILITALEHHANIVPWQILADETGAVLKAVPCDDRGVLDLDVAHKMLSEKTKIFAFTHVSNALGTINPVKKLVQLARSVGALTLVDAAQSIAHNQLDVNNLDCDFLAFSGHKVYGPTGIGVLYGKQDILKDMPPVLGGGEMITEVTLERSTFADPPARFEAGTPHIAGIIGLGAALEYLEDLGLDAVTALEKSLYGYAEKELLEKVDGLKIIGTAPEKGPIISFVLDSAHPHDAAMILDEEAVAVRSGHHCAQPVMDRFGIPATIRASFALYNTRSDVDRLVQALQRVNRIFS